MDFILLLHSKKGCCLCYSNLNSILYKNCVSFPFHNRWIHPEPFKKSISGDVVLITGGGSGIGRLMALKLSKLGAVIVSWDVNQAGNDETIRLVTKITKK